MSGIEKLKIGQQAPDIFNVVIEIPQNSSLPVKYEVDKESGLLKVDRFMGACMFYPCNYGYIPETLAQDQDPLDVLLHTPYPLLPGSFVSCRPLGMLEMQDEAGLDSKLLVVPSKKVCPEFGHLQTYEDLNPVLLERIKHFFEHYKDLDKGKWMKVADFKGLDAALEEIKLSMKRYREQV